MIFPVMVLMLLNFVVGTTYAFSFVLLFIVLIPIVLFNVMELHKKLFSHKVFVGLCETLWIMGTFFWTVNIWATGKYAQPYYMYETNFLG